MPRITRPIGDGALILALALLAFSITGLVWAGFYPTTELRITPTLGAEPAPGTEDSGFRAYAIFAIASSVIAAALAWWAYYTRIRGLGMLLWVTVSAALGSTWALTLGGAVVRRLYSFDATSASPGDILHLAQVVPASGVLVCAPAAAAVVYWLCACLASRF